MKESREWAEKHAKDVQEALKRHEQEDVDWREFIEKLRRDKEEKDAAKAQEEQTAAKIQESTGEAPAAAPAPVPQPEPERENLLEALRKK